MIGNTVGKERKGGRGVAERRKCGKAVAQLYDKGTMKGVAVLAMKGNEGVWLCLVMRGKERYGYVGERGSEERGCAC